jgi:hypothetical protein
MSDVFDAGKEIILGNDTSRGSGRVGVVDGE